MKTLLENPEATSALLNQERNSRLITIAHTFVIGKLHNLNSYFSIMSQQARTIIILILSTLFQTLIAQTSVVRGPYLQSATSSTLVIRWRTAAPTDSKVTFGSVFGTYARTTLLATQTTDHEVTLTDLLPSTKYYYTIGSTTEILQGDEKNYFITYQFTGTTQKLRFWVTGDCGNNSTNQRQVRDRYLNYVGAGETHGWLLLGDNAYNSGLESEYDANFFSQYQADIMKHTILWPSPGNHDYANDLSLQQSKKIPYYKLFTLPTAGEAGGVASGTESYYAYDVGNIHFISLDSYGIEGTGLRLYDTLSQQVKWLTKDLEANQQMWTIAYWHHPPYTKGSHDSDSEDELVQIRSNLNKILERYGVDLVLCGHSHSYERSKLIKGHYGFASSFLEQFNQHQSSARYDGTTASCPHIKRSNQKSNGTVYVVSGSAGQVGGSIAGFPHPAMSFSNRTVGGSLILEVQQNRLDVKWLTTEGNIDDQFTMMKDVSLTHDYTMPAGSAIDLKASWPGSYQWNKNSETSRTISVSPKKDTIYTVKDLYSCVTDTFKIKVDPVTALANPPIDDYKIELFPNPASEKLSIALPSVGPYRIDLLNVFGQVAVTSIQFCDNPQSSVNVDLTKLILKPGIYFVAITNEQKKREVQKIVIR